MVATHLQGAGKAVVTIVDHNSPDVHKDKEAKVDPLVEGKEKRVDVVGKALCKAVNGVEGVAGKRGGDNPLVVQLVEVLEAAVVQTPVDPVDAHVRKEEEREEGQSHKRRAAVHAGVVVQAAVAAHLGQKHDTCQQRHAGHRAEERLDL